MEHTPVYGSEIHVVKEIQGDLIHLALEGNFDVITHGCNCFCQMGAGIAVPMKNAFGCDVFPMEDQKYKGDINKLGTIDYITRSIYVNNSPFPKRLTIINSYTQYYYGKNHKDGKETPVDYDAMTMCMRKINHICKGKSIGLPLIGAGLAGGDWNIIKKIIDQELKDMDVTIVNFKS